MKRASGAGAQGVLSSCWFHLAVLALGSAFVLVGAFHGYIWFDESYSVAIANHSFSEIWRIGSGDVHPVLFYWALHVLNLVFGQNILVYRLFTVLGSIALASLGYTHVRRDFGWKPGVLFTAFVLFIPYTAIMSIEIRMYSWATFSVMLCALTAWRIACALREPACEGSVACVQKRAQGKRLLAGAPLSWWVVFAVSSLFSAYLHYFGAMSAFMVNLLLLIFCINRAARRRGGAAALGYSLRAPSFRLRSMRHGLWCSCIRWALCRTRTGRTWCFPSPTSSSRRSRCERASCISRWREVTAPCPRWWGGFLAATLVWLCAWVIWSLARLAKSHVLQANVRKAARALRRGRLREARTSGSGLPWALRTKAARVPRMRPPRMVSFLRISPPSPKAPRSARFTFGALPFGPRATRLSRALCARDLPGRFRDFLLGFHPDGLAYRVLPLPRGGNRSVPFCGGNASFSRIRSRVLVGAVCAILLSVSALNMTLLVGDFSASPVDNQEALDEVRQTVDRVTQENDGKAPLVVSSDIGYISLTTLATPTFPKRTWIGRKATELGGEAYSPTLTCKKTLGKRFLVATMARLLFWGRPKTASCRATLRTSRSATGSSCGSRAPATVPTNVPGLPSRSSIRISVLTLAAL